MFTFIEHNSSMRKALLSLQVAHALSLAPCAQATQKDFGSVLKPSLLQVQVLDELGAPLSGAEVSAVSRDYGFRVSATAGVDGKTALRVMNGAWDVLAVASRDTIMKQQGRGYLLVERTGPLGGSAKITLRPTRTVAGRITCRTLTEGDAYLYVVPEPYGKFLECKPALCTRQSDCQLLTNCSGPVRSIIWAPRFDGESLYYSSEITVLGNTIAIDVTPRNSTTMRMNAADVRGNPAGASVNLHNADAFWAWNAVGGTFRNGATVRLSNGSYYALRSVELHQDDGRRYNLALGRIEFQAITGNPLQMNLGGRLTIGGVRSEPVADSSFAPGTQLMLLMRDSYGNLVRRVLQNDVPMDPEARIISSRGTSDAFEAQDFFTFKLKQSFARNSNPRYSITWNLGPWGNGVKTGDPYGREERWMDIVETPSLIGQAPYIDPDAHAKRLNELNEYERLSAEMQRLLGVPFDYKQGVISNIMHLGMQDEIQHGYKNEIAFELDAPPGSRLLADISYLDHEMGHGATGRSPATFFAFGRHGEDFTTLIAYRARANLYGGDEFFKFLLGSHDAILNHLHNPGAPVDDIEMMQACTGIIALESWTPHERLIMEWEHAFSSTREALKRQGYSELEQLAALYSWLTGSDLAPLFRAASFDVESSRTQGAIRTIKSQFEMLSAPSLWLGTNTVRARGTSVPLHFKSSAGVPIREVTGTIRCDASLAELTRVMTRDIGSIEGWQCSFTPRGPGLTGFTLTCNEPASGIGSVAAFQISLRNRATGKVVFRIDDLKCNGKVSPSLACALELPSAPVQTSRSSLPSGQSGTTYQTQLEAIGGNGTYSWARVDGDEMPEGLTLSRDGIISGKPTRTGTWRFRALCTDGKGNSAGRWFTLSVCSGS